jgi:hypothetical protein
VPLLVEPLDQQPQAREQGPRDSRLVRARLLIWWKACGGGERAERDVGDLPDAEGDVVLHGAAVADHQRPGSWDRTSSSTGAGQTSSSAGRPGRSARPG